jgi:hypothetical protein
MSILNKKLDSKSVKAINVKAGVRAGYNTVDATEINVNLGRYTNISSTNPVVSVGLGLETKGQGVPGHGPIGPGPGTGGP